MFVSLGLFIHYNPEREARVAKTEEKEKRKRADLQAQETGKESRTDGCRGSVSDGSLSIRPDGGDGEIRRDSCRAGKTFGEDVLLHTYHF